MYMYVNIRFRVLARVYSSIVKAYHLLLSRELIYTIYMYPQGLFRYDGLNLGLNRGINSCCVLVFFLSERFSQTAQMLARHSNA